MSAPRLSHSSRHLQYRLGALAFPVQRLARWLAALLLLVILGSGSPPIRAADIPVIKVDETRNEWVLNTRIQYLIDETRTITLEDIRAGRHEKDFQVIEDAQANFGFRNAVFWMRFDLRYQPRQARGPKTWWLSFNYPLLDYVDIHYLDARGRPQVFEGGDLRPFVNNTLAFPRTTLGLTLEPGQVMPILIRVESQSSVQLSLSAWSDKGIADHISGVRLLDGILFGIMAIMALYNLFLYLAVRDVAYFYYVVAISTFIAGQATLNGMIWQYAQFKDLAWNNIMVSLTLNITWAFLLLFSRAFLQTKERAPILDGLLKFASMTSIWLAILCLFADYRFTIQLSTRVTMIYAFVSTLIGIALWRRGYTTARYYTLAWGVYMGSVLFALMHLFGVLPYNYLTANGFQIGAFGNVLLMSLGLADRINMQKKETDVARRRALAAREEAVEANRRALSNLQKFRRLYENASEGIFQCTLDGRFISGNPSLANVFGYDTAEELIEAVHDIGEQCYQDPEQRKEFERTVLEQGRIIAYESVYRRRDGSQFWGSSSAHLVRDGEGRPLCIEGSLIDINERMEKEKAQRERQAAEASASSKSEFLANMSHEIRTPMNAIVGFAALAQKTTLDPKQRDYIEKIEKSSRALLGIINDILDFSKIEAGKLSLELVHFNLYDILNDIVNILSQKAADKNLELVVRMSPDIVPDLIGDPLRLEQVMINLTNNAIKFTAEGEVVIRVMELQRLDERTQLQFEIIDTGIGITPEQKQKLFTPFTQADGSTTRKYGGTGLGLSISKQLVELMAGEIWVDSTPGVGSTFAFSAWFGRQTESQSPSVYAAKELKDLRILVIDDKDSGQETLLEILASFHCLTTAIQPDYALVAKLEKDYPEPPFDLVIVDRQLRAIESIEAARKIHGLPAFANLPILLMTLSNEPHLHEEASNQGFHVLIKPVTPSVILDAIQSALGFSGSKPARQASVAEGLQLERLRGHRVLLVEDTLFNQEIATEFLQQAGLQVTLAENGRAALERLEADSFDVVLMDVQMPVMDGFEATRQIRSQSRFAKLPVIAMTANAMKGDRNRCLQAGMNDYVSKPVSQDLLYQALLRWIAPSDTDAGGQPPHPVADSTGHPAVLTAPPAQDSIGTPAAAHEPPRAVADTSDGRAGAGQPASQESPSLALQPQSTTQLAAESNQALAPANRPAPSPSEAEVAPLNLDQALVQMGGSVNLMKKMLNRFVQEQEKAIEKIMESYDAGDLTTAHRLSHTLKGIAGSVCATDLREAAAALEAALESGSVPTQVEKLFSRADAELAKVIGYLKSRKEA